MYDLIGEKNDAQITLRITPQQNATTTKRHSSKIDEISLTLKHQEENNITGTISLTKNDNPLNKIEQQNIEHKISKLDGHISRNPQNTVFFSQRKSYRRQLPTYPENILNDMCSMIDSLMRHNRSETSITYTDGAPNDNQLTRQFTSENTNSIETIWETLINHIEQTTDNEQQIIEPNEIHTTLSLEQLDAFLELGNDKQEAENCTITDKNEEIHRYGM